MVIEESSAIARLPFEILGNILRISLRDEAASSFTATLYVSRTWNKIGTSLLWKDIVLDDRSIKKFIDGTAAVRSSNAVLDCIRSLTLRIVSPGEDGFSAFQFASDVEALSRNLKDMRNLRKFSVVGCYGIPDPWLVEKVNEEVIIHLINHCPIGLQHLEIDNPIIFPLESKFNPTCLCEVISRRLQNLQHLRLRWPRLCTHLFDRPLPMLRSVYIDCCSASLSPFVQGCRSTRVDTRISWDEVQRSSNMKSRQAVRDLLNPLRDPDNYQTQLPSLENLIILEPFHFLPRRSTSQWFLLNVHTMKTANANSANLTTTSYPIWPTGFRDDGEFHFIIRHCIHRTTDTHDPDGKSHDCALTDLQGAPTSICHLFETGALHRQGRHQERLGRFLNKAQWTAKYRKTRATHLLKECGSLRQRDEPKLSSDFDLDLARARSFHQEYDVKASMVGADYIWFLEARLSCNVLVAREYLQSPESFPFDQPDETILGGFTNVKDRIRKVQEDIPWVL